MSNNCGQCEEELPIDGQYIQCKAGCKNNYHFDCTTLSRETYNTRSKADRNAWRCHQCRAGGKIKNNTRKKSEQQQNKEEKENGQLLATILEKITEMQNDMKYNYETLKAENEDLKIKMDTLIRQNKEKDREITKLKSRLNQLEQYTRRDCIEIHGMKEDDEEKLEINVLKIINKMNIVLKQEEITAVHRIGNKQSRKPRIIIVKLNRKKADEIVASKKKTILNKDIFSNNDETKIYINESMSPEYKELFWKTKNAAKENEYKFVWFKRGKLYVRKNEGAPVNRIYTEEDINVHIKKDV